MHFELNNFDFHPSQYSTIEKCLEEDGYARIQFSSKDFSPTDVNNWEKFFVEFIEKLGGRCVNHNEDDNSSVWHVQPIENPSKKILPRSQTDDEFFFHTDCSFEINPPEFMALFVLQPDQFGGGNLEIIQLEDILQSLSETNKNLLRTKSFRIEIPEEFRKNETLDHIYAPILFGERSIRYRSNIISEEFDELNTIIRQMNKYQPELNQYTMILLNNHRFLHGRTKILDHQRHLLRIRFNRPFPFDVYSIYNRERFSSEYLRFENNFADYLEDQHRILYRILHRVVEEYFRPTNLGEFIRQTFEFNERIQWILQKLNLHRPNYQLGLYRPDVLFHHGNTFQINGELSFHAKICEINTRFLLNGFFLSSILCSTNPQNRLSNNYSHLIETIIQSLNFNRNKSMFILKGKEHGYDIHLFQQYWQKKFHQQCWIVHPQQLTIRNNQLIDQKSQLIIEQCLLELHQEEIQQLSDEILEYILTNKQLNYFNDFRTIFLLHDKRLFSLLSNPAFVYPLLNNQHSIFHQFIPLTYVIKSIPDYLRKSIIDNKHDWMMKSNSDGKGENIFIGLDVSSNEWLKQLLDENHRQWIIQQYHPSIDYQSMNLAGTLFCINEHFFNLGIIRLSSNKIVNISHGGFYIRPYVHRQLIHSMGNQTILSKDQLHEQLIQSKTMDDRWNKSVYASSSGGSAGRRLFFLTDIQENLLQRKILTKLMIDERILSSDDICLNLFPSKNIYRSSEIFTDFCIFANCTSLPMNADATNEQILEVIRYFQPNILMGSPFRLMQLAEFFETSRETNIQFEKIFFACESLDERREEYFRKVFHCSIYLGFYGSAETGVFACQSPKYSSTKIYLYPKELVDIEIINSKIIVTNLIRKRNQLIRFDTKDLGRILFNENNSSVGLIEVFESERLIDIDDETISKTDIEQMMKQFELIEWQLVIDYRDNREMEFLFRYVSIDGIDRNVLEESIRNSLMKISKKFHFRFQPIEFNQLITDQISNKLLKIIDRRT